MSAVLDRFEIAQAAGVVMKELVARETQPLLARIALLEKRLNDVEFERGEPGPPGPAGRDGENGKDANMAVIEVKLEGIRDELIAVILEEVNAKAAEIQLPKDGAPGLNGKDAEVHAHVVMAAVIEYMDAHPIRVPQDGRDGRDGKDGRDGVNGKSAPAITDEQIEDAVSGYLTLHPPIAGKDASAEDIRKIVSEFVDSMPRPKDGAPGRDGVDGESVALTDVLPLVERTVRAEVSKMPLPKDGRDGRDGRDGVDGEPGRDAAQIEVLDTVVEGRIYPRGTWAAFDGGLFRYTGADWVCVVDGVKEVTEEFVTERELRITTHYASGKKMVTTRKLKILIYREVWKEALAYEECDVTTWAGSMWFALRAMKPGEKPGESGGWKLCVKQGRPGRSE